MPSLGADMDEGTLLEWLVHPGDEVHRGDILAVVDTAKSAVEVEVFSDGVVDRLLVEPGTTVPVGTPLALMRDGTGAAAGPPTPDGHAVTSPLVRRLATEHGVPLERVHGTGTGGHVTRHDVELAGRPGTRVRSSPLARRRAAEAGIDLTGVPGSGPGGAVVARDVSSGPPPAVAPRVPEPAAAAVSTDRMQAMRQVIATRMARSKREIPHYYLSATVELGAAMAWLREQNETRGVRDRLVPTVLLLKAAALAARQVPQVNGHWVDDAFRPADRVDLGVAVSLRGGGLVAPPVPATDTLSLDELNARVRDLVTRVRAGALRSSELADPTLTATAMGEQGAEAVFGVIYPPQVALVGFGRVGERPWAEHGLLGVRPLVTVTFSGDHRAHDGHVGGRYLAALETLLHTPEEL